MVALTGMHIWLTLQASGTRTRTARRFVIDLSGQLISLELTFIVLALPDADTAQPGTSSVRDFRMVGDVNLFLPDGVEGDAECEIMIACTSS